MLVSLPLSPLSFKSFYGNQEISTEDSTEFVKDQIESTDQRTQLDEIAESYQKLATPKTLVLQENEQKTNRRIRLIQRIKKELKLDSPTVQQTMRIQESMPIHGKTIQKIDCSASQHSTVFITPSSLRKVIGFLGEGGQGRVFKVVRVFNDENKENNQEALKIFKRLPSNRPLFNEISEEFSEEECTILNLPQESYSIASHGPDKYCDVLSLAEGDFEKFDFSKVKKPVQCMLNCIKDTAQGVYALHKKNIIHRDIKPGNILVSEGGWKAQLADFDLMSKIKKEKGFTSCTPHFAHPSIWENDLIKQIMRDGIQTKADDAFALGRTIQYRLILQIFASFQETKQYILRMCPLKQTIGNRNDLDKLIENSRSSNKLFIVSKIENNQAKEILIYPTRDELNCENEKGLSVLEQKLGSNSDEYQALHLAIQLAHDLQSDDPTKRLSMNTVVNRIQEFQDRLKKVDLSKPVSTPPQIEKRSLESTDKVSQQKKRTKTQVNKRNMRL